MMSRCCVQHVVSCHAKQIVAVRQTNKRIVANRVEWVAMIPQFDNNVVTPKRRNKSLQLPFCRRRPVLRKRTRYQPASPARKHPPVADTKIAELFYSEYGVLFATRQLSGTNCGRQLRITNWVASNHHHITSGATLQLCAEYCWQTKRSCSFRKTHDAVQPVAIGQCKCTQPNYKCLLY